MRTPPSITYSGLTIILDEPSRFDKEFCRLLSGPARPFLDGILSGSGHCVDSCDIRTCDESGSLLPNTKGIILSGARAAERYNTSCDPPGYTTIINGIPALPIFYIQDACDFKNMRNVYDDDDEDKSLTDRESKEKQPTRRKNYRFWISWHIRKFLGSPIPTPPKAEIISYPKLYEVNDWLSGVTGQNLFLDIETSRIHRCLTCIGLSSSSLFPRVYVVPVYLSTGNRAYDKLYLFIRQLALAFLRNQVVIHNSMFDLMVLCGFYCLPYPKSVYDTMAAQHRISIESEKSLAHTISAWTDQPNHKNFDTEIYDQKGEQNLWTYNGFDVYNLKLIMDAQLSYAATDDGLMASIQQANQSILPYLDSSLKGLRLDQLRLATVQAQLLRKKRLFERMASILVGKTFNPGSTKQCSDFLHNQLNYGIVSRTNGGAAALGSQQLYQLQLKYNNPLIPVILKYREVAKDASSLESELFTLP